MCIAFGGALVLSLFATSSPAAAQYALLDALSRRVTLAHSGGLPREIAAERIIRSGDTVATDETGRAVVTYPDGSTALLEENSALTIEFVQTSAGDYAVRMRQTLGRVWYAVTRAVTLGSRYEVRSAAMASVIRAGSDSYVAVSPNGETTVVTISGAVETTAGGVEMSLPAGSSTTVAGPGEAPVPAHPAAVLAQAAISTPRPSTTTPKPPTPAPTRSQAPTPAGGFTPAVATLPPLPVKTPTAQPPSPRRSISSPTSTPRRPAAPAPLANQNEESDDHDLDSASTARESEESRR